MPSKPPEEVHLIMVKVPRTAVLIDSTRILFIHVKNRHFSIRSRAADSFAYWPRRKRNRRFVRVCLWFDGLRLVGGTLAHRACGHHILVAGLRAGSSLPLRLNSPGATASIFADPAYSGPWFRRYILAGSFFYSLSGLL